MVSENEGMSTPEGRGRGAAKGVPSGREEAEDSVFLRKKP
jgi:hypothetical protein